MKRLSVLTFVLFRELNLEELPSQLVDDAGNTVNWRTDEKAADLGQDRTHDQEEERYHCDP